MLHEFPFLLVDRVLRLDKGAAIQALKSVTVPNLSIRVTFRIAPSCREFWY
ncbi:(3R)-hydroxymyristoyl-ACP dehydratase (plasmid) [Variovorax sp. PBL-E5]|nr:(3R)-hydroxymyristoyl-ACP dehydratase [Variovorax sp. PBL-E5]